MMDYTISLHTAGLVFVAAFILGYACGVIDGRKRG